MDELILKIARYGRFRNVSDLRYGRESLVKLEASQVV